MCSIDVNEAGPKNAFGSRFNIPFPHSSLGPPQFAVLEWAVFPPSKTLNSPGPWWFQAKYPEWRVWDSWILSKLYGGSSKGGALEVDQYQATHPIEVAVNHPSEVQEIFDDLSALAPYGAMERRETSGEVRWDDIFLGLW